MFSRFFIDRPIFAAVLSIFITLAGGIAAFNLPLAQFPQVSPPTVSVTCQYPGASAKDVAESIAAPIEQQVNGVEGMMYMSSSCTNDGNYSLTVTFEHTVDVNMAQVLVENRVNLALPLLPTVIKQTGVTTRKRSPDILMGMALHSTDGRYDQLYLSNYALIQLRDELLRVAGVSDILLFGQQDYSMRIWVDPERLAARNLNASDVALALREQNIQVASGTIGQQPARKGQQTQIPLNTLGRLSEVEQFGDIIVKIGQTHPAAPSTPRMAPLRSGANAPTASTSQSTRRRTKPTATTTNTATTSSTTTRSPTTTTDTTGMGSIPISSGSTTSGGATSTLPGGATGGGASTSDATSGAGSTGGGTTAGGAMTGSSIMSSAPSSGTIAGLSINSGTAASANGALSGETMGRGPGRPDGRVVRLKDVARVELGAKSLDVTVNFDGNETIFLAVFQMPDANALDVHERVMTKMHELEKSFPEGMVAEVAFDTTPYTSESIKEVLYTLRDAIILVAVVVLLFLQNWRSAIIPLIAVPVAIVGTFAVMLAMGFSLNNLTLFGLVLAIGIVVDDAIVVVEAVEHHIEHGLAPREATIKAMDQVSGPVIAVGLVLSAVFVPCAFISGITGHFFRQFAMTISVSTVISAFNSLTLSPALAALLLRRQEGQRTPLLPRLIFMVGGGWVGWTTLTAWCTGWLSYGAQRLSASLADSLQPALPWVAAIIMAVAGGAAGWMVARFFNAAFAVATRWYTRAVGLTLRLTVVALAVYGVLVGLTIWRFRETPKGFIPAQDMGYLMVNVQLPDSASAERTDAVMRQLQNIARATPGILHATAIRGQSFVLNAYGSNFGSMFINLDSYENRRDPSLASDVLAARLWKEFGEKVSDAQVQVFGPPPVRGAGRAGGFAFMLEDRGDLGSQELQKQTETLVLRANGVLSLELQKQIKDLAFREEELQPKELDKEIRALVQRAHGDLDRVAGAEKLMEAIDRTRKEIAEQLRQNDRSPEELAKMQGELQGQIEDLVRRSIGLAGVFSVFRANVPQLRIEPDFRECLSKGVSMKDFADTLAIYQGSTYVNDFNLFGRTWQVIVQAESRFRDQIEDLPRLKVRNSQGSMVPLGSLASVREVNGPLVLTRYNMYPAASIMGSGAPGMSSFDAIAVMQKLANEELPRGMAYEWTDMSYLEVKSGDDATKIFGFAVLMVFLVLAFQYENWSLPLAVILVVPMCLLSAIIGVNIAHMDINIFTRIGFVVLVGLASKNAILIVEFAKVQRREGVPRRQATLEACKLRLRPIIMTSLAFVLGVLPLMISHGAGFEMRRTLGTAVFSGMLGVTLFGIFLTPVFFYTIDSLSDSRFFASPGMRLTGRILLDFASLGLLRLLPALFRRRSAPVGVNVPVVSAFKTNGQTPPAHLRESVKQK